MLDQRRVDRFNEINKLFEDNLIEHKYTLNSYDYLYADDDFEFAYNPEEETLLVRGISDEVKKGWKWGMSTCGIENIPKGYIAFIEGKSLNVFIVKQLLLDLGIK